MSWGRLCIFQTYLMEEATVVPWFDGSMEAYLGNS